MSSFLCTILVLLCSCLFSLSNQEQHLPNSNEGPSQIAIVSTVDGLLHGLQVSNGELLWTTHVINQGTDSKSLVSSTLDKIHIYDENDGYVRIIPSLKGDLFKWNGESLDQFPTNADMLLSRSTKLTENTFASGAIAVHTLSVNARSGKVNYRCNGNEPCRLHDQPSEKTAPDEPVEEQISDDESDRDLLLVRSTERTVRAVDELNGTERWNFSVIDVDISYSAAEKKNPFNNYISPNPPIDTLFNMASNKNSQCAKTDHQLRLMTPEGAVFGLNKDGELSWSHKFDAPVANVWKYDCESLVKLDLSDANLVPDLAKSPNPSLYLGSFSSMWYVQVYRQPGATTIHSPPLVGTGMFAQRKLTWVPYLATSPSRTPYLNQENANIRLDESSLDVFSSALMPIDNEVSYPYDAGYSLPRQEYEEKKSMGFYFVNDQPDYYNDFVLPRIEGTKTDWVQKDQSFLDSGQILAFVPVSLSYYWRQIVALTALFGFLLNVVYHFVWKLKKNCEESCVVENESQYEKDDKVEIAQTQEIVESLIPAKSSSGFNEYFHFQEKLGKGGFGSVYVAQHKLDLQKYAIKRIELPSKIEAADKMRREVRALSRLNHVGIVRYYNSWEESVASEAEDVLLRLNSKDTGGDEYSLDNVVPNGSVFSSDMQKQVNNGVSGFRSNETNGTDNVYVGAKGDAINYNDTMETSADDLIVFRASTVSQQNKNERNNAHSTSKPTHLTSLSETSSMLSKDEPKGKNPSVKNFLYIQMELCRPNTLKDWLVDELERDRNMTLHIFHQIVEAVAYLHDAGQFHRDLKPSNIFFSERDAMVKIGDFGLVTASEPATNRSLSEMEDSSSYLDRSTSVEATTCLGKSSSSSLSLKHTSKVGTKIYMSPEQRRGRVYDNKVDIYALGIILYELLQPFGTESERIAQLKEVRELHFPPQKDTTSIYTDDDLVLIKSMLSRDPTERPSSKELGNHEILKSYEVPSQDVRMQKISKSRSSSNCDNFSSSSPGNS